MTADLLAYAGHTLATLWQAAGVDTEQPHRALVPLNTVFVLLFVTLGPPLKTPMIYFAKTRGMAEADSHTLAWKTFLLATVAVIVGGFLGIGMMHNWHVSTPILLVAGGLVFFLVSLRTVLDPFESKPPPHPAEPAPAPTAFQMAVPMIVTPWGIAGLIIILANSHSHERTLSVIAMVLGVMILHYLAMRFSGALVRTVGPLPFQLFGAIIGILTVALSLQMINGGLVLMGLMPEGSWAI